MNIIVILASGVGNRFGDPVPKQYHLVKGRPIIEYTISSAIKSQIADHVLVVARGKYVNEIREKYGVETIQGGAERNLSFQCALDYIKEKYECRRLVVVDAVNPLVTASLFDRFFGFLDEYDVAITTSKIPTSLGCYDQQAVDRSRYYMIQNPQAYQFDMVYENFDGNSKYTVIAQQMPEDAKVKLYWGFKNYAKVIYPHDIAVIEALLDDRDKRKKFEAHKNDACLNVFRNLRVAHANETRAWEKTVDDSVAMLFSKWEITEYDVNSVSWKGLVFEAFSEKYGDVVLKLIPPFIDEKIHLDRFERELCLNKNLSKDYIVELLDYDYGKKAILLKRIIPGDYVYPEGNREILHELFQKVLITTQKKEEIYEKYPFPEYYDELEYRKEEVKKYSFHPEECNKYLQKACGLYREISQKEEECLLHGDMHRENLLKDGQGITVIDPWGFFGLKEMELAVYIAYALFDHPEHCIETLNMMKEWFGDLVPEDIIHKTVYIQCCMLLAGTIFGKDDNYQSANKWYEVINIVYGSLLREE